MLPALPAPQTENPLLQAALQYASFGWHVFPCKPFTKFPAMDGYSQAATVDPHQIIRWWHERPNANIGIMLEPSGLVAYDVDVKEGREGRFYHSKIEQQLTPSLMALTPSGGFHLYYRSPGGIGRRTGVMGPNSGIDILGRGFVLAAPSVLGEPADQTTWSTYRWVHHQGTPLNDLPRVLFDLAHRRTIETSVSVHGAKPNSLPADGSAQIPSGSRNQTLFKVAASLRANGMQQEEIYAVLSLRNQQQCRPPLDDEEVQRIAESAMRNIPDEVEGRRAMRQALDLAERQVPKHEAMARFSIQNIAAKPIQPIVKYETGMTDLDTHLGGGIATRQLQLITSKPAAGKTALVMFLIRQVSENIPCILVSTETESAEVVARLVAHVLPIAWRDLLMHPIPPEQQQAALEGLGIFVLDPEDLPEDIAGKFDKITDLFDQVEQATGRTPILVIDYLQELVRGVEEDKQRSATSNLSRSLKRFSRRRNCVVLAISSVSRAGYGNGKKTSEVEDPTAFLAFAKESGDLEYDAGTVIYLDMSDEVLIDNIGVHYREGRLAIAKCRHGRVGLIPVSYFPARGLFLSSTSDNAMLSVYQKMISAVRMAPHPLTKNELWEACKPKRTKTLLDAFATLQAANVLRIEDVVVANDIPRKVVQLNEAAWAAFQTQNL